MNAQELIEKLKAAIDGAIVLVEQWYNGAAPVSNRDNNDNWSNLMDAKRHLADLADQNAELIRKYNALCLENTPLRMELEILNNSLEQALAEIANLREQVRVRNEALRKIADSETYHFPCGICEGCEENVATAKAALDAAKEVGK